MPEILLTPELLNSEAEKMSQQKTLMQETVSKVQNSVNQLVSEWHGKTQEAFVNSINEKKAVFDKFAENDMGPFVAFLKGYASSMEQADSTAPSRITV